MKWMLEEVVFILVLVGSVVSRTNRGSRDSRLPARALAARRRAEDSNTRDVTFEHFDDYLLSIASPSSFNPVLRQEQSNPDDPTTPAQTTPAPEIHPLDILNYFKDVPRQHWSCCMLGKLAGDKGFHCLADFYASRVQSRNFNRAHNRRMSFHTQDHMTSSPRAIMRTFQRCVARHSSDFHKCCYAATVEREEMTRWQQFREHAQTTRNVRVELEN